MERIGEGRRADQALPRRVEDVAGVDDYSVGPVGVRSSAGAALPARFSRSRRVALILLAVFVMTPLLFYQLRGLEAMRQRPRLGSDYIPAVEYVAAHHNPGEPVIVAWPPVAYLGIETRDDIIFVPGPPDRERTQNFARINGDGEFVDFWTGSHTIVSTGQLCQVMLTRQNFWLIIDRSRLMADWAYAGEMSDVIVGLTVQDRTVWRGGQAMVLRLAPAEDRDAAALSLCHQAMAREGLV